MPPTFQPIILVEVLTGHAWIALCAGVILLVPIAYIIYNLYFHPLAGYPGPLLWRASLFPYVLSIIRGDVSYDLKRFHEKYGDVVRIAPNELSYRSTQAWKDVYANRPGHTLLPKEVHFYTPVNGSPNIITSDHAYHAKIRRNVANAFSEKALRAQEELIKVHIDLLVKRLGELADTKQKVDIVMWYNYCTFDLIGDLAFGKAFGCLQNSKLHPWVKMQFQVNRASPLFLTFSMFPFGLKLLEFVLPKGALQIRDDHIALTEEAVKDRLERKGERADFIHFMDRDVGAAGNKLSFDELVSNAAALINAGSETTATLLSGTTFYLLCNPGAMKKITEEIRSAFRSESEIDFNTVSNLKYTMACLNEGLRVYPPVPTGLPRVIPLGGEVIIEKYVPANTIVSVNNWACYHSEEHFKDAEQFVPERWMDDPKYADDDKKIWQPFSTGPRVCIGRNLAYVEMRLILAKVLYNFDMRLELDSVNWKDQKMWVLWDKPPLNVTLTRVNRPSE